MAGDNPNERNDKVRTQQDPGPGLQPLPRLPQSQAATRRPAALIPALSAPHPLRLPLLLPRPSPRTLWRSILASPSSSTGAARTPPRSPSTASARSTSTVPRPSRPPTPRTSISLRRETAAPPRPTSASPSASPLRPTAPEAPAADMGSDAAFHQNVQDIFFDYDSYDLRPDATTSVTSGRHLSHRPPFHQGRHRRLLRRPRIGRVQPGARRETVPTLLARRWSPQASPQAGFASSATARRSSSAPKRMRPAGSRTGGPNSHLTASSSRSHFSPALKHNITCEGRREDRKPSVLRP